MTLIPREEFWQMSEPEKVAAIIRRVGCSQLGNWDGCCCSVFSIRNVRVEISCGKGMPQGVKVSSRSMDYTSEDELRPVMAEVVRQVREQSGRNSDGFVEHISIE